MEDTNELKQKLLNYQSKYGISSVRVFNYRNQKVKPPVKISEKALSDWISSFELYVRFGGNVIELK